MIGEAVALLSSPPTSEELGEAVTLLDTLLGYSNELNSILNEIRG